MDIEFHYYMTNIIARRAGFTSHQSTIIAYSSQYVDDNDKMIVVNKGKNDEYESVISQTMNITKPKKKLVRIYLSFHFIPGEYDALSARRKDCKLHQLTTTPDSNGAREIMEAALSSKNMYRIGMASHAYVDTWAHQNFVGCWDYFNAMSGPIARLTPNVGHADARHNPDIPGLLWKDKRLCAANRRIDNTIRFLAAARALFLYYINYARHGITASEVKSLWQRLEKDLVAAIGKSSTRSADGTKERVMRYKDLIEDASEHDKGQWFNEAIATKIKRRSLRRSSVVRRYSAREGFKTSNWFKFQKAVRAHRKITDALYTDLYEQMELQDRNV